MLLLPECLDTRLVLLKVMLGDVLGTCCAPWVFLLRHTLYCSSSKLDVILLSDNNNQISIYPLFTRYLPAIPNYKTIISSLKNFKNSCVFSHESSNDRSILLKMKKNKRLSLKFEESINFLMCLKNSSHTLP